MSSAIVTAVEDEAAHCERCAIYHVSEELGMETFGPVASVFAVKEPFFTQTANAKSVIRIEHLSDIERLEEHELMPTIWREQRRQLVLSAARWKELGNTAMREQDPRRARFR